MDIYKKQYKGQIKIEELTPEGYSVSLFVHGVHHPIVIAAQLHLNKFIKFFKDEIRTRQLHKNDYLSLNKKYTINNCNE